MFLNNVTVRFSKRSKEGRMTEINGAVDICGGMTFCDMYFLISRFWIAHNHWMLE
jgi:hypothetical protein